MRSIRRENISGVNIYRLLLTFNQVYEAASKVKRKGLYGYSSSESICSRKSSRMATASGRLSLTSPFWWTKLQWKIAFGKRNNGWNSRSADEESSVNQSFSPIRSVNGCVFLFQQNGYKKIDLPRWDRLRRTNAIRFGERIDFHKIRKRVALHLL